MKPFAQLTPSLFDTAPEPPRPIFDAATSERRKVEGIELAANNRASLVVEAREEAIRIAKERGTVNADDVYEAMLAKGYGHHCLQNAAGAVFRDKRFEFTHKWVKSKRPWARSNDLRLWRLKT